MMQIPRGNHRGSRRDGRKFAGTDSILLADVEPNNGSSSNAMAFETISLHPGAMDCSSCGVLLSLGTQV
jgi:hypothetical protein